MSYFGVKKTNNSSWILRAFLIIFLIAIISATIFIYYLFNIKVTDPLEADRIYDSTIKRIMQREKDAKGNNGFDVLSYVLWQNSKEEDKAPFNVLVKDVGNDVDNFESIKTKFKNASIPQQDIEAFLKVLPKLEEAFSKKKFFTYPSHWEEGFAAKVPNFIQMRNLAWSLKILGVYYQTKNHLKDAVKCFLMNIEFGSKFGKQGALINEMIAMSIMSYGLDPLIELVAKEKFDSHTCKEILLNLYNCDVSPSDFLNAMDEEYVYATRTFNLVIEGKAMFDSIIGDYNNLRRLGILKLYVKREKKLYQNWYLKYRPYFKTLKDPSEDGLSSENEAKYFKKNLSFLCLILLPNFERAMACFKLNLTKVSALKIMLALKAFNADKGRYPETLEELVPEYFKELPKDYLNPNGRFVYSHDGKSFKLSSESATARKFLPHSKNGHINFNPPDDKMKYR